MDFSFLIELYNIIIKPESYGVIALLLLLYSYPKVTTFNKMLKDYEIHVKLLSDVKELLVKIDNGNVQMHEVTYRNIRDYTAEIKLLLKDVSRDIAEHNLTAQPKFNSISDKLNSLNSEIPIISEKMGDQQKIVEHLTKLTNNVDKVDHLLSVLFSQINNNTLMNRVSNHHMSNINDMDGIKF